MILTSKADHGPKNRFHDIIGAASLNLSEYDSSSEQKEFELNVRLTVSANAGEPTMQLYVQRALVLIASHVSTRTTKKDYRKDEGSEVRCFARSDNGEYPLDKDSLDGFEEGESDEDWVY
ncbi:hypothetical protein V6N13_055648 [Hibiscus sabdariffa]|uniref:Uncharacterized protein n=1 Tax=Hibiscus sabdariffa TaxID=183260 RepID=A0ABR2BM22_9ROSI